MSTILRVPEPSQDNPNGDVLLEIKQEDLKNEPDATKFTRIFEEKKVGVEYWLRLALMYHRNGQVKQFQHILSEALKDPEEDLEALNGHMSPNKKARHDAMNALASYYFQMYEVELQRVPCSDLADREQLTEAQYLERQAQQS